MINTLRLKNSYRNCLLLCSIVLLCSITSTAQNYEWKPLTNSRAYTIKVNPLNKNTLYIGNGDDRILRSYDAGVSWDTLMAGSGASGSHLSTLHICRSDTNILLAGGWIYTGLKRSVDGGQTWTTVLSDPTFARIWFLSEAIVEDPNSPNILYVSRGQVSNDFYRSTDCGATWELLATIPQSVTTRLHTTAIRPDSTNILFAGGQSGVISRSDDSGRTWRPVPVNDKLIPLSSDAELPKIVFSKKNPQIGYAVVTISNPDSVVGNGGLFKTTNGGASWNRVAFPDTSLWAVDVHAIGDQEEVWIGGFRTWTLPSIIKGDSIVRRSFDGGATWLNYDNVPWLENDQGRVIANVWVIRYDTLSGRLYLSTESGLYVLEEPVSVRNDNNGVKSLGVSVATEGQYIVITSPESQIRSVDIYTLVGELVYTTKTNEARTVRVPLNAYTNTPLFVLITDEKEVYRRLIIPR